MMGKKGDLRTVLILGIILVGGYFLFFSGKIDKSVPCLAWRNEGHIFTNPDSTPGPNSFDSTCSTGYVCVSDSADSTWELSYGHTEKDPAHGFCNKGFSPLFLG